MSEIGDDFKAMREMNRPQKERVEASRMESTKAALLRLGCTVEPGPDGFRSYRVSFPTGKRFVFFPYSGWWQGKTRGRGFADLVKEGTV
jgi:hypothetical protein